MRNSCTLQDLHKILCKDSPNVVFLSKTRLYMAFRMKVSFLLIFYVDCKGKSGGLPLLWQDRWEVTIRSYYIGLIDATICDDLRRQWYFISFNRKPKASLQHFFNIFLGIFFESSNLCIRKSGLLRETSMKLSLSLRNLAKTVAHYQLWLILIFFFSNCGLLDIQFMGLLLKWHNE